MNPTPTPLSPQVQEAVAELMELARQYAHAYFNRYANENESEGDEPRFKETLRAALLSHLSAVPFNQVVQEPPLTSDQKHRRFWFWINDLAFDQIEPTITGQRIREMFQCDSRYGVWQVLPGPIDPRINDADAVSLDVPVEPRFFIGKLATTQSSTTAGVTASPQPVPVQEPTVRFKVVQCNPSMRRLDWLDAGWWDNLAAGEYALYAQPVSQPGALCRKCGGAMAPGKAIAQTYSAGSPDFPGDTVGMTMSAAGPGKLVDCLKCSACGWSVSQPGEALPAEQPKSDKSYPTAPVPSEGLQTALREGCTPADAMMLRAANHALAMESFEFQTILRDLFHQVTKFCEEQGEADFETGPAHALLLRTDGYEVSDGLQSQLVARLARYGVQPSDRAACEASAGSAGPNKNAPESSSAAPVEAVEVLREFAELKAGVVGLGAFDAQIRRLQERARKLVAQPPQAVQEDERKPYLKDGETPAQCIERHRREQDGLMRLLAQARTPLTDEEVIALLPAGWTGMLAQVMQFARRIESATTKVDTPATQK